MEIKYSNRYSELITEQETEQINFYSKLYFEEGELKKQENYKDKELIGGTYYLSEGEKHTDILNQLGAQLKWVIGGIKQVINGYRVHEFRSYDENLHESETYSKLVKDHNERIIAVVSFDTISREAKGAYKVFYFGGVQVPDDEEGVKFDEDAELTFSFKDNGEIKRIDMNIEYVSNNSNWSDVASFINQAGNFIGEVMTIEQLNYFTTIEPVVPNFKQCDNQ